jgi:hypothetical protein
LIIDDGRLKFIVEWLNEEYIRFWLLVKGDPDNGKTKKNQEGPSGIECVGGYHLIDRTINVGETLGNDVN